MSMKSQAETLHLKVKTFGDGNEYKHKLKLESDHISMYCWKNV